MRPTPPPAESRRERNKREKRDRLREAAGALFETQGFEATSTREIAERADIAAGTLFLYADDKVDLLFLVMGDELAAQSVHALGALDGHGTLAERLLGVFRSVVDVYARHPRVAPVFIASLVSANGRNALALRQSTLEFIMAIASHLETCKVSGEVDSDVDSATAAQGLFAMYYLALQTWASGLADLESMIEGTLRACIDVLLRGLTPRSAPSTTKPRRRSR